MKYMLDTSICIELIRRRPPRLIQRLTACAPGEAGLSVITVAELVHGVHKSEQTAQNASALERFLLPFEIADFDWRAAQAYGMIRAALERDGSLIGSMDLLIAAHALSLDVTLVTNNEKEFRRIPGLSVENWLLNRA